MPGPVQLVWTGGAIDDEVMSFSVDQSEGDCATLTVSIRNPRVGLLSLGLNASFSYDGETLFNGRLVGVPDDMQGEIISLTFLARPDDYDAQKLALANTLKTLPAFDPIFYSPDQRETADVILEARSELWHTDRVSHVVTLSDIITGDETVTIPVVFYDSLRIQLYDTPAERATVTANVTWGQAAKGSVDLTRALWKVFDDANSTNGPCIASLTGGGLLESWPKVGQSIGSGWTVGDTFCERVDGNGLPAVMFTVHTLKGTFNGNTGFATGSTMLRGPAPADIVVVDDDGNEIPAGSTLEIGDSGELIVTPPDQTYTSSVPESGKWSYTWPNHYEKDGTWKGEPGVAGFPVYSLFFGLMANYDVSRPRTETVKFEVSTGVQPLLSSREDANITFDISGSVDQPIDTGGKIPVGDVRRRSYLLTARGRQSIEHMLNLARAQLTARARAVRVSFETTFDVAQSLTLRKSATVIDERLPGGQATGKVAGLSFGLDGADGAMKGSVTLACMVGTGGAIEWSTTGTGNYGPADYSIEQFGSPPSVYVSTQVGGVVFEDLPEIEIPDDGVDLSSLNADTAILIVDGEKQLFVDNGLADQKAALLGPVFDDTNQAMTELNDHHTKVRMSLVPLEKQDGFLTDFGTRQAQFVLPKTIDLTAGSSGP